MDEARETMRTLRGSTRTLGSTPVLQTHRPRRRSSHRAADPTPTKPETRHRSTPGARLEPCVISAVLGLLGTLLLGILANDLWTLASAIAHRIVTFAARLWSRNADQAEVLAEEWRAYINDRPGQLLKLATALGLLLAAAVRALARRPNTTTEPRHRPEPTGARLQIAVRMPAWMPQIDTQAAERDAVPVWLVVGTAAARVQPRRNTDQLGLPRLDHGHHRRHHDGHRLTHPRLPRRHPRSHSPRQAVLRPADRSTAPGLKHSLSQSDAQRLRASRTTVRTTRLALPGQQPQPWSPSPTVRDRRPKPICHGCPSQALHYRRDHRPA